MTPAAANYFSENAQQWDAIRSGYFGDEVRQSAIAHAYLRPDFTVADVGAGTGYVSAGLAPLVQHVYALDGSAEMLETARHNLSAFDNVTFHQADGLSLPLPDESVDVVFANMYLHHCTDPLAAIQEMTRLLKPGGRLVITDMDAHTYAWMREEMSDVWLGFERAQVRQWFEQAGLVNVIVDCSGQSCQADSTCACAPADAHAQVSIFLAVGGKRVTAREQVGEHYRSLAESGQSCCAPSDSACCSNDSLVSLDAIQVDENPLDIGYSPVEKQSAPPEAAAFSLGCGNPLAMADLRPGETVLDIGSGGGFDCFIAARQVGPNGRVIGVDMTPAMLERARASAQRAGITNVEFRQGQAEHLPVEDGTVDVIMSNCVINLTEDKGVVFREAYRALRPGGRVELSDVVTDGSFPAELRGRPENWGSCVYGALPEGEYLHLLSQAGFENVTVRQRSSPGETAGVKLHSAIITAKKPA
jgi:ubiquinone/menaquinone biosynthesis C-methylase UbiE